MQAVLGDQRLAEPDRGLQVLALLGQHAAGELDHLAPVGGLEFVLPFALRQVGVVAAPRFADLVDHIPDAYVSAGGGVGADGVELSVSLIGGAACRDRGGEGGWCWV